MKSEDFGILFLHNDINDVVLNNLDSVYRQNPGVTVVTISADRALPGGYSLNATPAIKRLHDVSISRGSDWLLCSWVLQRKQKFSKLWIVKWDTYCTKSVRDFYDPVWRYPFVASGVRLPYREPGWWWFRETEKLPREYQLYATGAVPFIYLMDDNVVQRVCTELMDKPFTAGNGELRLATVANICGFPPCAFSPPQDQITHLDWEKISELDAIFHPVRYLVKP